MFSKPVKIGVVGFHDFTTFDVAKEAARRVEQRRHCTLHPVWIAGSKPAHLDGLIVSKPSAVPRTTQQIEVEIDTIGLTYSEALGAFSQAYDNVLDMISLAPTAV